jgi:hypothetical protein
MKTVDIFIPSLKEITGLLLILGTIKSFLALATVNSLGTSVG